VVRYQLLVYVFALCAGVGLVVLLTDGTGWLEFLIWPSLAALLYTTFCQVHPREAVRAFLERRFLAASLLANFLAVPLFVWAIVSLLPLEPAISLGVYLVLLVPCTDWFMTFTHLGQGSARLAIALTPVLLLVQLAFLPLYLLLFLGAEYTDAVRAGPFLAAFVGLIAVPFLLAFVTQAWADRQPVGVQWLRLTGKLAVPLLSLVIFLIAASQAETMLDELGGLAWTPVIFAVYLAFAAMLARAMASLFRLNAEAGRTLAFNVGTRNSFVVLPLALALPAGWEAAVAVIVMQSFVELAGMIGFLWLVPHWLFRQ
jgi:ACR3 family arsenite transporter